MWSESGASAVVTTRLSMLLLLFVAVARGVPTAVRRRRRAYIFASSVVQATKLQHHYDVKNASTISPSWPSWALAPTAKRIGGLLLTGCEPTTSTITQSVKTATPDISTNLMSFFGRRQWGPIKRLSFMTQEAEKRNTSSQCVRLVSRPVSYCREKRPEKPAEGATLITQLS